MGAACTTSRSKKSSGTLNKFQSWNKATKPEQEEDFADKSIAPHSALIESVRQEVDYMTRSSQTNVGQQMSLSLNLRKMKVQQPPPSMTRSVNKIIRTQRIIKAFWGLRHCKNKNIAPILQQRSTGFESIAADSPGSILCSEENLETAHGRELRHDSITSSLYHLSSLLTVDDKCGLCDFFDLGHHHRWNTLDSDIAIFNEISRVVSKWAESYPGMKDDLKLQNSDTKKRFRIILKSDDNDLKGIFISDGVTLKQVRDRSWPLH